MLRRIGLAMLATGAMATAASAACTAPVGRYAGGGAGLIIDGDASPPKPITGVENWRIAQNFAANGSGTVGLTRLYLSAGKAVSKAYNLSFDPRGTTQHNWNATTCQGKMIYFLDGVALVTLWYSVVDSGNEIIMNLPGSTAFTITLKRL